MSKANKEIDMLRGEHRAMFLQCVKDAEGEMIDAARFELQCRLPAIF